MSQQGPDLPGWITAALAGLSAGAATIIASLKSIFVTRAELKTAIEEAITASNKIVEERHTRNEKRFDAQDSELRFIRTVLGRIEGRLQKSGEQEHDDGQL